MKKKKPLSKSHASERQDTCTPPLLKEKFSVALAGVAQWIEHRPANQRVTGSILSWGTCLGWGPGPQ